MNLKIEIILMRKLIKKIKEIKEIKEKRNAIMKHEIEI